MAMNSSRIKKVSFYGFYCALYYSLVGALFVQNKIFNGIYYLNNRFECCEPMGQAAYNFECRLLDKEEALVNRISARVEQFDSSLEV